MHVFQLTDDALAVPLASLWSAGPAEHLTRETVRQHCRTLRAHCVRRQGSRRALPHPGAAETPSRTVGSWSRGAGPAVRWETSARLAWPGVKR
jgi:hypothetical protein